MTTNILSVGIDPMDILDQLMFPNEKTLVLYQVLYENQINNEGIRQKFLHHWFAKELEQDARDTMTT